MDKIELYVFFVILVITAAITVEFGYRKGLKKGGETNDVRESVLELIPTGLLGLLALFMGFTFSMSISRYDARKKALIKEANAIGTVLLRSDLLPMAEATKAKISIRNYLEHRIDLPAKALYQNNIYLDKNRRLQDEIWDIAKRNSLEKRDPTAALFTSSVNEMIDLAGERDFAMMDKVPEIAYYMMFGITLVVLYFFAFIYGGQSKGRGSPLLLGLLLSLVIVLIQDMERPESGWVRVDQTPLLGLKEGIKNVQPDKI